jgi:hypothetical protein
MCQRLFLKQLYPWSTVKATAVTKLCTVKGEIVYVHATKAYENMSDNLQTFITTCHKGNKKLKVTHELKSERRYV